MDLTYQGVTLPDHIIKMLIKKVEELNVPPSYLIVKLHFEGLWGSSSVARENNNWSGMTWTGDPNRPSGVVVSKGGARPKNEGGNYMRYATLDDFFKDWTHLIRRGGSYKVADSETFDDAVKGMFKAGGAKYDYAASGYDHYLKGMRARRHAINKANNGILDALDRKEGKSMTVTAKHIIDIAKSYLGANKWGTTHKKIIDAYNSVTPRPVGYVVKYADDWCDTFVTHVFDKAGASSLIGRECGVERHKTIFKQKGIWKGLIRPQVGDIIIFRWDGNRNGFAHHIGIVVAVSGDTITTIEGNTTINGVSTVGYRTYRWNASVIQGYARPKYGDSKAPVKSNNENKSVKELADEVLLGLHGNGNDRKASLGSRYQEVKDYINNGGTTANIDQLARDTIAGKFGTGEERKQALGSNYDKVQARVNELLKETSEKEVQESQKQAIRIVEKSTLTEVDKNEIAQKILNLVSIEDIKKILDEV